MTNLRVTGIVLLAVALSAAILVETLGIPSSTTIESAPKRTDNHSYEWYSFNLPTRFLAHSVAAVVAFAGLICSAIPIYRRRS
jgi:hypothetical protein